MTSPRLADHIAPELLQSLVDAHQRAVGIPMALVGGDGESLLVSPGWKTVCEAFHYKSEGFRKCCQDSDLSAKVASLKEPVQRYVCQSGLWMAAVPIVVAGAPCAGLFLGQFFLADSRPDHEFFERQASQWGLDPVAYQNVLQAIPVLTSERLEALLAQVQVQARLLTDLVTRSLDHSGALRAMQASESVYRTIFDNSPAPLMILEEDTSIVLVNQAFESLSGYRKEEMDGKMRWPLLVAREDQRARMLEYHFARRANPAPIPASYEFVLRTREGQEKNVFVNVTLIPGTRRTVAAMVDLTESRRAEQERAKLEGRLLQAQKMESVGLLAGGIAHDFNNLLTPILGYSELLASDLSANDPRHAQMDQIQQAALLARDLTRQLLAFSRRQVLELQTFDLRDTVRRFERLLQRTIREDIKIVTRVAPDSALVRADVGQIEQVLMNLAVNAQDAMPQGGALIVEVAALNLENTDVESFPDMRPGPYAVLAVSDTGTGMDQTTRDHLFEPFFTTKGRSKGTGLGLSTVYGIVRQHGGGIAVYSELGKGSSFKVYLPRLLEGLDTPSQGVQQVLQQARGKETILVVEDNDMVRSMVLKMLEHLGYQCVCATDVPTCKRLLESEEVSVDLLLADVVMPDLNGKDLYAQLRALKKNLRVLFMSGYTSDVIAHHGVLEEGMHFLPKPITLSSLAGKVREALDGPPVRGISDGPTE